jgi:hypothetical protein
VIRAYLGEEDEVLRAAEREAEEASREAVSGVTGGAS